jgi:hypothetical protein
MHHFPMGATTEVMGGVGDFYMLGHAMIGDAVEKAGLRSHTGGPLGSFRRRLVCSIRDSIHTKCTAVKGL